MDSRKRPIPGSYQPHAYASNPLGLFDQYGFQQPPHFPGHRAPTPSTVLDIVDENDDVFQIWWESFSAPYDDGIAPNCYISSSNAQYEHYAELVGDEGAPAGTAAQFTLAEQLTSDHGTLHHVPHMAEQGTSYHVPITVAQFPTLATFDVHVPHPPRPQKINYNNYLEPASNGGCPDAMPFPNATREIEVPPFVPANSAPDEPEHLTWTANVKPESYALEYDQTVAAPKRTAAEGSSRGRKRRRVGSNTHGTFGEYAVADVTATVMHKPSIDPRHIHTGGRRTRDSKGEILRTRKHGAMEIDDSCTSAAAAKDLPAGMACVRQCEWGDSPCGLYVEFNKNVVSKHLFEWHGVNSSKGARCKFEGCSAANKTMKNLGRHIATVHLDVTWQCCYCRVVWSRSDAAKRHYPTCDSYKAAKELAGDRFKLEPTKMIRKGYIVPAHGTTSDEI